MLLAVAEAEAGRRSVRGRLGGGGVIYALLVLRGLSSVLVAIAVRRS
jgi:hypothetical protein